MFIFIGRKELADKQYLKLPVRFELIRHSQQAVFAIWVGIDAIRDWCLGLSLLRAGLIDAFVMSPMDGRYKLDLQLATSLSPQGKIQGNLKADVVSLRLTSYSLDYLLTLCLKYCRDGYAEVDHMDLEAMFEELGNEDVYITFKFAEFAPPVNIEEAKRRLRD